MRKHIEKKQTNATEEYLYRCIEYHGLERIGKRIFDFTFSLAASVMLLLPMGVIAILIMLKDPGNPFYIQKRLGKDRKIISVVKFRSMKNGAENLKKFLTPEQREDYFKEYKLKNDPRLIGYNGLECSDKCFGAFIRERFLDELPQILVNVCILGNMSLIGPRPVLEEEMNSYYSKEQQTLFTSIKPGLTGYWQAYGHNTATYENGRRQKMELYYVKNRSWKMDIKILFHTFCCFIGHDIEKINVSQMKWRGTGTNR